MSNKYHKNSKISKFDKILDLEREKAAKEGFEKSANFAIVKAIRIFLAMWKDWAVTNVVNLTMKFNKILDLKREMAKKDLEEAAI